MKKVELQKVLVGLATASIVCAMSVLITSCIKNAPTMKGTTYVNGNAEHKPMVFMIETVGVLEFTDDSKVDILFPYAIDTKNLNSAVGISSELWIPGEYEKNGNVITIRFKLNDKQEDAGVLEIEINDDGKILLGKHGERFNKMDKKA